MKNHKLIIFTILIICLLPWITYLIFFRNQSIALSTNIWGEFGSFIGGTITAITIPVTLYFVLITFKSQKILTEASVDYYKNSDFENYFFELLKTFNEFRFKQMKLWVKVKGEKEWQTGIRFFAESRIMAESKDINTAIDFSDLDYEYYFRTLNEMIKWTIETDKINDKKKTDFLNLIKSSLTNDEKYFIKHYTEIKKFQDNQFIKNHIDFLTKDMFHTYEK